ncbi:hypothetical protein Leryth_010319 [Lithospermum erythrorhizon]|nr:hypothetical protein Leryth_010319 [Lithospermum erythrorhizon]
MPIIEEVLDPQHGGVDSSPSSLTIFGFTFSSSQVQLGSCSTAAESSCSPSSSSCERVLVGFLETNVVGLQYYGAKITVRQMVGLIREPINSYDPNAIRVVNIRDEQVGHIERRVAAVLAPLIDSDSIVVRGIAKPAPGKRNVFRLPCEVHVFSRVEVMERVKSEIAGSGLEFISGNNPAYALSEAVAVKDKRPIPDEKSVDEIFSLLDKALSKEGTLVPMEPPKTVITTELLSHQKEGLRWLFLRENSQELPPFWEKKEGKYVNVLTCFETENCPDPFLGGIFADDMGMGKTLTLLSLIATDKCGFSLHTSLDSREDDHPVVRTGKKRGKSGKWGNNVQKKCKLKGIPVDSAEKIFFRGQSESLCSRTTLIVCPTSVLSAWIKQLEVHTRRGSLRTYLYHGERTKDANEVQKYDLVLTTYSTVASEASSEDSPLKKVEWWRIILDEAHLIKNPNAQQSRAVASLTAKRRWVVSGTPIQNDSFDMFSLLAFLRLEPLSTRKWWNNYIAFPLNRGEKKGLSRLQVLMASISLRRTKEKCLNDLPSKSIQTFLVDLSEEEREFYDQMEAEVKNFVQGYISSRLATSNYTNVLSILIRLRQACVDIALCPSTIGDLASLEDARSKPELLNKLKLLMDENEEVDFDCPICITTPSDAVITSCAHIFCRVCILTTLRKSKESCPLCRCPLLVSDLYSLPPEVSSTTESSTSTCSKSSKVMALLKLLSASQEQDPTRKSVVFSQFRKLLISLEGTLKEAGFKVLRVDGSMTARKRGQIIEEFDTSVPDGPTILLASLKAVGAGVNLTAASQVYLMEPWWNPAVEEQAMDRVHRIGQAKEVNIVRMIARNTVEERILLLQEKKKLLAKKAFGRKGSKEQREITASDLATLMNL